MESLNTILLNAGPKTKDQFVTGLENGDAVENYYARELFFLLGDSTELRLKSHIVDVSKKVVYSRFSKQLQFVGLIYEFGKFQNAKLVNPILSSYNNAAEKIAQMLRASLSGVPIPKSVITTRQGLDFNRVEILEHISLPLVVKTDGMKGEQVHLISHETELSNYLETLSEDEVVMLQEFVPNSYDIRIIIAFNKPIGSIKRIGGDSFLNNVAQGGKVELHSATDAEIELALQAMKVNCTDVAGVDIIYHDNKPLFLELNQGFGVEGFETIHSDHPVMTKIAKIMKSRYSADS